MTLDLGGHNSCRPWHRDQIDSLNPGIVIFILMILSSLVSVMAWHLLVPSHYWNQWWLIYLLIGCDIGYKHQLHFFNRNIIKFLLQNRQPYFPRRSQVNLSLAIWWPHKTLGASSALFLQCILRDYSSHMWVRVSCHTVCCWAHTQEIYGPVETGDVQFMDKILLVINDVFWWMNLIEN